MLVTVKSGKPHLCRNIQSSRLSIPFVKIGIALLETIFKGICKGYNFYSLISLEGLMCGSGPTASATDNSHPNGIASCGIQDRKSTRLNSSHVAISYAVFCL